MSTLAVNAVTDANGGNTTTINSMTPTADSLQGFRNRIINGDMRIDQRNAGAAVTPTNGSYSLDRWQYIASQASKFTVQKNAGSVTPPAGFTDYLGMTVASTVSVGASDYFAIGQAVEGFNVADLGFGTANAKTITVSFWVRSSLTGTFGGSIRNVTSPWRSYPFTYTISSADTWEYKTVTVAGDTTGTWNTTTGKGLQLFFGLGAGATFSGTAGAWDGNNLIQPTGTVSVVGTNAATWYVTGVQLEVGSVATPFERRPYGTELALCQRYFQMIASGSSKPICITNYFTSSVLQGVIPFKVTMRTTPTFSQVTGTNYFAAQTNGTSDSFNSVTLDSVSTDNIAWYNNSEVSGTAGQSGYCKSNNASSFLAVQAEL